MPEYRLSQEKNGIKVEMVVTVNGTVKVGFLITNNYGGCFVDLKYYDTLGNTKTVRVQTVKGDLNKSTGVIAEFPKPSKSFDVCFDIVNITTCEPYPKPQITRVVQPNPILKDYDPITGAPIYEYQDIVLWKDGQQKVVPVFVGYQLLNKILGYSRRKCYWFPISKVLLFIPCFAGGYQWAVVSLSTTISQHGVDEYTDINVYPEGGYYWVTNRKHRNYYEDFYFDTHTKSVSFSLVYKFDFIGVPRNDYTEITIPVDCNYITLVGDSQESGAYTYIYHNDQLIARIEGYSLHPLITLKRTFKKGDKLKFYHSGKYYWNATDVKLWRYTFNLVFDKLRFTAFYRSNVHTVELDAVCVPEELADEYVNWLKSKGYNTVKINPGGTHSL